MPIKTAVERLLELFDDFDFATLAEKSRAMTCIFTPAMRFGGPIMREFSARCQPPWSEKELEHKLDSAAKVTRHSKPRGHLLGERGPSLRDVSPSAEVTASEVVKIIEVDASEPLPGDNSQKSVSSASGKTEHKTETRLELPPKNSETSVTSAPGQLDDQQLVEAHRIASELLKLYRMGIVKGADDPEAAFCADMLKMFGGTVIETKTDETKIDDNTRMTIKLTDAQRVRVPVGLHGRALRDYLQKDLEAAFLEDDDVDLSEV